MANTIKGQPTLHQKLLAIAKSVKAIKKEGYNDFNKYTYAKESDVLAELRTLLYEKEIIIIPSVTEQSIEILKQEGKADKILTTVSIDYNIVDTTDGVSLSIRCNGQGIDSGDKGIYKAYTGAMKYFLMKMFMIPTHDDPENEEKPLTSDETPPPPGQPEYEPFTNAGNPVCQKCGKEMVFKKGMSKAGKPWKAYRCPDWRFGSEEHDSQFIK